MINKLIDVSVSTMIGNLPGIINRNNDAIEGELDALFYYGDDSKKMQPALKVDVSSNSVAARTGYFWNINLGGKTLDASFGIKYERLDASVQNLETRVEALENAYTDGGSSNLLGSMYRDSESESKQESFGYDMSEFWTNPKAKISGLMVENIIFEQPYCIRGGIVIPLYVGVMNLGGRLCSIVYYDEMTSNGVFRNYAPVKTTSDGNSVVLAGEIGRIQLFQTANSR